MKNNTRNKLQTLIVVAFCAVFFGSAANAFAQTNPTGMPEPMVGGYNKAGLTDAQVVAAANFAVKTQAKKQKAKIKLVAVNNAAKQVVAGMNYQVCLSVETTDRQTKTVTPQIVQAVVYQTLKNKYQLTSWTVAACTDAAPIAPVN